MALWGVNASKTYTDFSSRSSSALESAIRSANNVTNANTSTNTNANISSNAITTSDVNIFNPVFAPVNNIEVDQNDSSTGRTDNLRGDPKLDIVSNPSVRGGDASATADIKASASSDQKTSASADGNDGSGGNTSGRGGGLGSPKLMSALGAAAAGYLVAYALEFDTSNSMIVSAINGISNLAGNMIVDAASIPGGMLTGTGLGVGSSFGGMYYMGLEVQSSLGIAMAGGIGGAAVGYLAA